MNIFKRFWKSLYSPADIASFRNDKIRKSIVYIIVLSFVTFLPLAYFTNITTKNALKVGEETITNEIPDFKVTDGKLVLTDDNVKNIPISIDQNELHIYFDASGTLDKDDVDNKIASYDSAVAFLSDCIYITAAGVSQSVSYDTAGISDKADLVHLYNSIESLAKYFIPIALLVLFIFTLGSVFFRVALYALFGFILSGFGRTGIAFRQNWMIASYSITLAAVFTMIMEALQIIVPFGMEINMVVSMIFVFLAIRAIPPSEPTILEK
ncbi:DUF1189 domain-containing protein [Listeria monocytogenes]|nr:DUF1189 domain-containing protein [Listeria monocytogenes]EEO2583076.1 DUF1189 domain-containing protein [Listeria monocytogenes]EEO2597834.1 DUF1189 domain-containing protein [Listeria monocytogenes]EEO2607194.1 DUF1189 domain-containing protein [Listeria monocytogenes]EEO9111717.1 DUF1189 domain-containing protein [Listeria monocytogenes]